MKKKNTYQSTDITASGANKHMSGIHNKCIRTNQYVWDMMKVLDRQEMYGFHFEAKVGVKKIMVILHHESQNQLDTAQKILKNVAKNADVLFLTKLKEKKTNKLGMIFFISIFSLVIMTLIVSLLFKNGYFDSLIKTVQSKEIIEQSNIKKVFSIGENEPVVEEIVIDIEKLKLLKESFEEQNSTSLSPKVMKALTMSTAIISEMVSEEEKAKYSAEALVKSFKGKSGFKLVIKEEDKLNKDFNKTVKELNAYAMHFVQENNLSEALSYYDKVSKEDNISKKEAMINSYHKAEIFEKMGLNEEAKSAYANALNSNKDLNATSYETEVSKEDNGTVVHSLNELISLGHLAKIHQDLNETKKAKEIIEKAQNLYKLLIVELKKYGDVKSEELALALNYLASFYTDNNQNLLSIEIRKEALKIYEKLLTKESIKFGLTYYKTLNSLGEGYLKIEKIKLAKQTYKKSFDLIKKLIKSKIVKDKSYKALSYRALAMVAIKQKKLKEAKKYYINALNIYRTLEKKEKKYQLQIADMHGEFAVVYALEKKFKLAKKEYREGIYKFIKMNKKAPLKYNLEIAKLLNSSALMKISNYDMNSTEILYAKIELRESKKWAKKAIEINFKEAKKSMTESYAYLAYIAGSNKDMVLALEYYKISYALKRVKGINAFKVLKFDF